MIQWGDLLAIKAALYIQTHAIIIGRLQLKIRHSFDILLSAVLEVF
jgi:hypothetical protein